MVPERARHKLRNRLTKAIGEEDAGTLMEMLPPFPWTEIATKADLSQLEANLTAEIKLQFAKMLRANFLLMVALVALVLAAVKLA